MQEQNVVLLHGALGSSADLRPLAETLRSLGCQVHKISFSGHGGKPFESNASVVQYALELRNYIQENEIVNPLVFGYSMGGYVALKLATEENPGIGKIITLGTKFNWESVSLEKELKLLQPDTIEQKVPAFAKSLAEKHGASWKELLHKTAGLMKDIHEAQYLNDGSLQKISIPVMIGIGDKDQMVSLHENRRNI